SRPLRNRLRPALAYIVIRGATNTTWPTAPSGVARSRLRHVIHLVTSSRAPSDTGTWAGGIAVNAYPLARIRNRQRTSSNQYGGISGSTPIRLSRNILLCTVLKPYSVVTAV